VRADGDAMTETRNRADEPGDAVPGSMVDDNLIMVTIAGVGALVYAFQMVSGLVRALMVALAVLAVAAATLSALIRWSRTSGDGGGACDATADRRR
jgi:hypothetical protein